MDTAQKILNHLTLKTEIGEVKWKHDPNNFAGNRFITSYNNCNISLIINNGNCHLSISKNLMESELIYDEYVRQLADILQNMYPVQPTSREEKLQGFWDDISKSF